MSLTGFLEWFRRKRDPQDGTVTPWERAERFTMALLPWLVVLTLGGAALLLITPDVDRAQRADEKLLSLGLTTMFAAITALFLARLIGSLERGDSLGVESHWGGLGGGVGGWRLSRATVNLLCAVSFAALAVVALSEYGETGKDTAPPTTTKEQATGKQQTESTAARTTTGVRTETTATSGTAAGTQGAAATTTQPPRTST